MNLLLTSRASQRPSVAFDPDAENYVFRGPVVRRISAEQFLDGLDQVILAADKGAAPRSTGQKRAGLRKLNHLMRILGRTKRDVVVTRRESSATTAQLIELSNGKPLAELVARGGKAWLGSGQTPEALVSSLFANALGRAPSDRERQSAQDVIGNLATAQGIEDLLWMLAMHPEFQLIH